MKITKLKNGNYSTRIYVGKKDGKSVTKRVTAPTPKALRKLVTEIQLQMHLRASLPTPTSITFGEAFDNFLEIRENVLSPSTMSGYLSIRRCAFQRFMNMEINDITEQMLQAEVSSMASKLSFKTISIRTALFIQVMAEYRREAKNWRIKMPPKKKVSLRIPTRNEVDALVSYCAATKRYNEYQLPIMFGAFCGLRRGEIVALTYDDIDIKNKSVRISKSIVHTPDNEFIPKTPKSYAGNRTVPLTNSMMDLINERKKEGLPLITITLEQITDRFPSILKGAGVEHVRFHDLRHFFASTLVTLNIPDLYAIKLTGHSTTTMLRRVYQHTFEDQEKQYQKKLLEALG